MSSAPSWVTDENMSLLTDLYELTMVQAYWRQEMMEDAAFSLYFRELPANRNFILACGLDDVLHYLENVRFSSDALDYLSGLEKFSDDFLGWLEGFRFEGDVFAMPEGTPFFPDEPVLELVAPLPQAQLVESFILNQVHFQCVLASKAARVVASAGGRSIVDFGMRRMHGTDAGMKAARAFHIAGVQATSNVLAGKSYGIPVTGTMAHSYIQAHATELDAFREFAEIYPETVLLVDTYETLEGVRNVIRLAGELGEDFSVSAIRLDSGDLAELAARSRRLLDEAGLENVKIFASGGLDEYRIRQLLERSAPISGFGVGTSMGVSEDAPSLDMAYKLTFYAGRGRLKLSSGKKILPGRKQVFRVEENGRAKRDIIGTSDESHPGKPLLFQVMSQGGRTENGLANLEEARHLAVAELEKLPDSIRALEKADPSYPVSVSEKLRNLQEQVAREFEG